MPPPSIPDDESGEANGVACAEPDSAFLLTLPGVDGVDDMHDPSDSDCAGGRPAGLCDNAIVLIGPSAPNLVRTVGH